MQIDFSIKTKYGNYNDTLFFPDGVEPTEEEIKKLKEARVQAWVRNFNRVDTVDAEVPQKTEEQHKALLARGGQ